MPNVELYPFQANAIEHMHNGCILDGAVGTGKSITSLAYVYTKELKGKMKINGHGKWSPPTVIKDIYIITTAKKRDSGEWEDELAKFDLSTDPEISLCGIRCFVDSWNNIKKYTKIYGAVFIFDEDKVTGKGAWVKSFLNITRKNRWIILSATPGDKYDDYVAVWMANGCFHNRYEFDHRYCVMKPYLKYRCVDYYVNTRELDKYRQEVLVHMTPPKENQKLAHDVWCLYDKEKYLKIWKTRWNPYDNCPIDETGMLCYLLRRVSNESEDRQRHLREILSKKKKVIIFYNFTFELEILREICTGMEFEVAEWNGEKHEEIPTSKKWAYLCQYTAASEGFNCITTDTIIFYSLNYSYKIMTQAAGRVDRLNTPFPELHYYYLKSRSPIDLGIMRALSQKKKFNEAAFLRHTV